MGAVKCLTYIDKDGIEHYRQLCSISGCDGLRVLKSYTRKDKTKITREGPACGYHRNNGEEYPSVANGDYRKRWWKKHGIEMTVREYNERFEKQQGRCLICGRHQSEFKTRLAVDHNHETGKIRGLLCQRCNANLGWLETDTFLERVIDYLE